MNSRGATETCRTFIQITGLVCLLSFVISCTPNLLLPLNRFARTPQPAPPGVTQPPPPLPQKDFIEQTFAGYQGWFAVPGLSYYSTWFHWSVNTAPAPGNVTFELYPDVREYAPSDLASTSLGPLGNGTPSQLYASDRDGIIDTHFRWMYQYGVDGVALQRFVSELGDPVVREFRNRTALKIKASAEKWSRSFYMEYDISGSNQSSLVTDIQNDWSGLESQLVNSIRYARRGGKPVVALWGFGFTDRPGTTAQALQLIQWFQNKGYFVIGGIPYYWRTENIDSKPGWLTTYLSFDMLQPWSVGRYANVNELQQPHLAVHTADKQLCAQNGRYYQRVVYPGFSWSNAGGGVFNLIPRMGGDFMWKQGYYANQLGVTSFIAMFDEYDEGTAIAKAAENVSMIPSSQSFLTLNADGYDLSSDFYLRLSGELTKMLRHEQAYGPSVPIAPR